MRRAPFHVLTLLSLILCLLAIALWWRSSSRMDTIVIRTSPSYAWGPDVKWVVIRTYDGWVVSLHRKVVPRVDAGPPPWRADVPLSSKTLRPPNLLNTHGLTDAEQRQFHEAASEAYGSWPVLRWESRPHGRWNAQPGSMLVMPTWWTALAFKTYPVGYLISDPDFPGAYRDERVGVPHAIVVGVSAVLPALWAGLWTRTRVRNYVARRRVGLCPGCGYDLRESKERCPECGRPAEVAQAAPGPVPENLRGGRVSALRWWVARASLAGVLAALVLMLVSRSGGPVRGAAGHGGSHLDAGTRSAIPATAGATVQFEAVWQAPGRGEWPSNSLALVGPDGEIAERRTRLTPGVFQVAVDPEASVIYGSTGHGVVRERDQWGNGAPVPLPRGYERNVCVAFDARRRRLVVAASPGWGGSSVFIRDAETKQWSAGSTVGRNVDVVAIAYSAADDCLYAVSASTREGPAAVIRLTPEGEAEWRIPLAEWIPETRAVRPRSQSYQLAAAGPHLALIIGGDPYGRGPQAPQRLILIDPRAGQVVFKGGLGDRQVE